MFEDLVEAHRLLAAHVAAEAARESGTTAGRGRAPTTELLDRVRACQRVVDTAHAVQTLALAQLAARDGRTGEDGVWVEQDHPLGHVSLDAASLASGELGVSERVAAARVAAAADVAAKLPGHLRAMAAGEVDLARATAVADELALADPVLAAEVEARVLGGVLGDTPGPARRRCRRVLGELAPDLVLERARRTREDRSLTRWQPEPGVAEWQARLPADSAALAWAAVEEVARRYRHEGRAPTLDAARADALLDLVRGQARTTVHVVLTAPGDPAVPTERTVPGDPAGPTAPTEPTAPARGAADGDRLVTVGGVGDVTSDALGAALAGLPVRVSRLGEDASGRPVPRTSEGYRPPRRLVDLVRARDGRCRFPRCTVSARQCDLDHVRPWPLGATSADNLVCLCRRHHRVKQRHGWSVTLAPDGAATWVSPVGRRDTTLPEHRLPDEVTGCERSAPGLPAWLERTAPGSGGVARSVPAAGGEVLPGTGGPRRGSALEVLLVDRLHLADAPTERAEPSPGRGCRHTGRHTGRRPDLHHPGRFEPPRLPGRGWWHHHRDTGPPPF